MASLVDHLHSRHLDLNRHEVWLSEEEYCCTFPLYSVLGQMVGYHQYRPNMPKEVDNNPRDSKYFTFWNKRVWVPWGLELLNPSTKTVFITEGVFDACRLTKHGFVALATLTNSPPKDFKNFLSFYSAKKVVILDNDPAGMELKQLGEEYEIPPEGDLGSSPESFVNYLIQKYS